MDYSMKKTLLILLIILLFCTGCSRTSQTYDVVATTLPVYEFASAVCKGTPLTVDRLITENVSCLHDYSLQVSQMQAIESAEVVVISGAGLEDFLQDALQNVPYVIDCSTNTHIHSTDHHDETAHHDHNHDYDPHIWLSPENAAEMVENICHGLEEHYPQYSNVFQSNTREIIQQLADLQAYGESRLSDLTCRELITFHDGFAYFAESFNLTILEAVEEEAGSEASAAEIIHLINLVANHELPAVFTEKSGSDACAGIISAETGAEVYMLDMAMAGNSYFKSMYHNIDTIKEALG